MKRYQTMALSVLAGAVIGAVAVHGLHAQAKPSAYAIVENDVRNPEAYAREFAPLAGKALTEAGGKFLARRGRIVAVDGEAAQEPGHRARLRKRGEGASGLCGALPRGQEDRRPIRHAPHLHR